MDWKDLRSLLARPAGLLGARIKLKKTVSEILSEVLGVSFSEELITIKNGVVFLNCHPALKSEVYMKRSRIFERLESRGVARQISDIR